MSLIYIWTIDFIFAQESCLESYGVWLDSSIVKLEYEYLEIHFFRPIKQGCKSGPLTLIWKKDGKQFKIKEFKKTPTDINEVISFYSLSTSDSGIYTLWFYNNVLNFTYNVELVVNSGSESLKQLRYHVVPLNSSSIIGDKLYWMPRMITMQKNEMVRPYDSFTLKCMFYSTRKMLTPRVDWYFTRSLLEHSLNDLLRYSSRVNSSVKSRPCFIDHWMPNHKGYCYVTKLYFDFFKPTDSGSYSCVINNTLYTSFLLFLQVTSFGPEDVVDYENQNSIIQTNTTLSFNTNDTVCTGHTYVFQCLLNDSVANLSLWYTNSSENMSMLASVQSSVLYYHVNNSQLKDSGNYLCRSSFGHEKYSQLLVHQCKITVLFWYFLPSFAALIFLIPVVMVVTNYMLKIYMRLDVSKKIQSKFKVEAMYRNERYVPLQPDPVWEIGRENIIVTSEMLGCGEYGKVFKGRFKNNDVAVKVAKFDGCAILAQEIEIMKQLQNHQNIIRLLGVCSRNGPLMAILELAEGGNLKQYLLSHNPDLMPSCHEIGLEQLLSFVTQISSGMEFLSSKQVIHRDLAARNCLMTRDLYIKLSDFGLTRLAGNYYMNESQGVRAIAWTAPESILNNVFTSKSDVWSFGIVMWEVFELGATPYYSLSPLEIIELVQQGFMNPKPSRATDDIYAIMTRCWSKESNDRPTFSELKDYLNDVDVNEYL